MTTLIDLSPPRRADTAPDTPNKWRRTRSAIRNKPWELLDRAAESPTFHTAAALGMIACWSYNTQANGHTKEMSSLLQHTIESGAHPVLGFVGAWLGYVAAKSLVRLGERRDWDWVNKKSRRAIAIGGLAIVGVATGDFAGEMGQGIVTNTYFEFLYDEEESIKDLISATGGGMGFVVSNLREKRKKSSLALHNEVKAESL